MSEPSITWGIIGCGDVAEVKSGPAFQKCNQSELLAVMRRNTSKAKDFAKRHKVPVWYSDASQLLSNKEVDAVYIATPPSSHLEYALQALAAGKHVYLEKPMVLNQNEASILANVVKQSNGRLVVAHYRRYLPMYQKVKSLVDSNAIGDIRFIDIKYFKKATTKGDNNWRLTPTISGGGLFHDLAPHQLDLMYYYFGAYDTAYGFADNHGQKYGANDIVNGIMNFKNGIQFRGIWGFEMPDYLEQDSCSIYGSLGMIQFPFYGDEVTVKKDGLSESFKFETPAHIQQPMIQESVNYFLDKRSNPCSVEEGTVVTKMMDAFTNKKQLK